MEVFCSTSMLRSKKVLVFRGHSLAIQASRLARQYSLEYVVDPGGLRLVVIGQGGSYGDAGVTSDGSGTGLDGRPVGARRRDGSVARAPEVRAAVLLSAARGRLLSGGRRRLLGHDDLVDVVDEKIEELVGVLLHVIVELNFLFSQSGNKLLGCNLSHFLLLSGDRVEEVSQAGQEGLLAPLVLGLVLQHPVPERLAEVQGLQHRVGVAGVAKVDKSEVVFVGRKHVRSDVLLQL